MSPSFDAPTGTGTPFGRNEFLRSVKSVQFESYTMAKTSVPNRTFNGVTIPFVQPGTVLAKITAAAGTSTAADVGKVGPFQASVTDGRQTLANIVGLLLTFLPVQFMDRDVEVSAMYAGTAVQGWCLELDAAGAAITLTNTTADAMRSTKGLDILFK
jgi:hypothetical protein